MLNGGPINAVPLNAASVTRISAIISAPGYEGVPQVVGFNDYTGALSGLDSIGYVMDLTVSGELVRVPIRSWQATLRTDAQSYVQCVVPSVSGWTSEIIAATAFSISRYADIFGVRLEEIMAESDIGQRQFSQGPTNHSCVLSGYTSAFVPTGSPSSRQLSDVRSVSTSAAETRIRAAIDWLLRPGDTAAYGSHEFVVSYINYYALQDDAYMDVGG